MGDSSEMRAFRLEGRGGTEGRERFFGGRQLLEETRERKLP